MGRELKFRRSHFIDEQCTKFHHSDYWGVNVGIMGAIFTTPSQNNTALYFIDDQVSGLKDEDNVDIFEGDVCQTDLGNRVLVVFRNGCFMVKWDDNWFEPLSKTSQWCKVVGNIRCNSDLLPNMK